MFNRFLFVLALVVVLASATTGQAALVSFILDICELAPGSGVYTLSATANTGDNAGIASYGAQLTNVNTVDHKSPSSITNLGTDVGFRVLRSSDNDPSVTASQNTFGTGYVAYGIGQTAGDLTTAIPGTESLIGVVTEGNPYTVPVELASGSWSGALPGIDVSGGTGANVFTSTAGLTTFSAPVAVSINFKGIPEPSALALAGLAVACFAAAGFRRRRLRRTADD